MTPLQFLGTWTFEREIDDRRQERRIRVAGVTEVTRVSVGEVIWHEEGSMLIQGAALPVEQTRRIVERAPGVWDVLFSDGRLFHGWAVAQDLTHDCEPDLYRGRLDPSPSSESWKQVWAVSGPAKNYVSTTRYARSLRDENRFVTTA